MRHFLVPEAAYAPGPSEISRQAGMNRLFQAEKFPLDCTQTVRSGRNTFLFNFAAGRDGWVIPSGKMPSGLYIAVRPEGIFLLGISQSPGPPEIFRDRLSA